MLQPKPVLLSMFSQEEKAGIGCPQDQISFVMHILCHLQGQGRILIKCSHKRKKLTGLIPGSDFICHVHIVPRARYRTGFQLQLIAAPLQDQILYIMCQKQTMPGKVGKSKGTAEGTTSTDLGVTCFEMITRENTTKQLDFSIFD